MGSTTKTIKLTKEDAARLADLAAGSGRSLSQLVGDALEQAVDGGLDPCEPLPAGPRMIGPRLDVELVARAEEKATRAGVSFGAYMRTALAGYLELLAELGGDVDGDEDDGGPLSMILSRERRQAAIAGALAASLRRTVPEPDPAPSTPTATPRLRRPLDGWVVSGCLHVTREPPDAGGFVRCRTCGRSALPAEPGSGEWLSAVERERLRRRRPSSSSGVSSRLRG